MHITFSNGSSTVTVCRSNIRQRKRCAPFGIGGTKAEQSRILAIRIDWRITTTGAKRPEAAYQLAYHQPGQIVGGWLSNR